MRLSISLLAILCLALASHAQQPSDTTSTGSNMASSQMKNAAPPSERVVMKVGDQQITQAQFETMVSDLEAQQGPADLSRKAIGDNFAQLLALSQQAVANKLDQSPAVVRQLALDRTQILSNAEFADLKQKAKPTAEEISAYYNAHLEDYDTVQLRRLFIWSGGKDKSGSGLTPQAAAALADKVHLAFASGTSVKKVIEDTPHKSDDVLFDTEPLRFQRGEMPPQLDKAAFTLKVGGFTELNDAPGTYVFLQLVARGRRDLKDVSPQIEKKLQAQKLKDELANLKKTTGIWMDEAYFAPTPPAAASKTQSKTAVPGKSD